MQQCAPSVRSIADTYIIPSLHEVQDPYSLLAVPCQTATATTGSYATVHQACHKATGEVRTNSRLILLHLLYIALYVHSGKIAVTYK
jgi:hypothetical protein